MYRSTQKNINKIANALNQSPECLMGFDEPINEKVHVRVFDIVWDTDGDDNVDLPTEISHEFVNDDTLEEAISDWLSDEFGFCHEGFQYEITKETLSSNTISHAKYPSLTCGDYVISPCKNAFNNKVSYWISKKNMMVACYCFSVVTEKDVREMLLTPSAISGYITLFKEKFEK